MLAISQGQQGRISECIGPGGLAKHLAFRAAGIYVAEGARYEQRLSAGCPASDAWPFRAYTVTQATTFVALWTDLTKRAMLAYARSMPNRCWHLSAPGVSAGSPIPAAF